MAKKTYFSICTMYMLQTVQATTTRERVNGELFCAATHDTAAMINSTNWKLSPLCIGIIFCRIPIYCVLCLLSMPNIWNSLIAWEQRLELFHHKSLLYLILSCGFSLNVFVCRRGPPKNTCLIEFHFIVYLSKKTLRCSTQLYSSA